MTRMSDAVEDQRLRGEAKRLREALERIERVYERTMPGPRDALRDQVLAITASALSRKEKP